MVKFFKLIDIYGKEVKLRLKDKTTVNTTTGGILTILTCLISILVAFLLGQDVIYRSNPNGYSEVKVDETPELVTMTANNYPLAFKINDENNKVINLPTLIYRSLM